MFFSLVREDLFLSQCLQNHLRLLDHALPYFPHVRSGWRIEDPFHVPLLQVVSDLALVSAINDFAKLSLSSTKVRAIVAANSLWISSAADKATHRVEKGICVKGLSDLNMHCSHR